MPRTQEGLFVVRNASSGATYMWRVPDVPVGQQDVMFSLFNGAGSGVVLELVHADVLDAGIRAYEDTGVWTIEMQNSVPGYRVVRGQTIDGGTVVTPTRADTESDELPVGIECVRGGRFVVNQQLSTFLGGMTRLASDTLSTTYAAQKLIDQQQIGLLRGLNRNPFEEWGPGSANFPRRFGPALRVYDSRSRLLHDQEHLIIRRGEAAAIVHWYVGRDSDGLAYGSISSSDAPNTGAKFNILIEFNVRPGIGDALRYAPPYAGGILA